jgi:hypothetical protein
MRAHYLDKYLKHDGTEGRATVRGLAEELQMAVLVMGTGKK